MKNNKTIKINYKDAKEQTKNVNSLILHNKNKQKNFGGIKESGVDTLYRALILKNSLRKKNC